MASEKADGQTAVASTSARTLDLYVRRAGRFPRLSADLERRELRRLVAFRGAQWSALLSWRPARALVVDAAVGRLAEGRGGANERLEQALAEAADRRDLDDGEPLEAELIARLARHDDGVGEWLVGELDRVAGGLRDADGFVEFIRGVHHARADYLRAKNRFLCSNLRLVVTIASRYGNTRMSLADRVQEGNLGLLRAVERFDPERGTRFSTYAGWWIRHHVVRALVNRGREVRIPANLHRTFMKARDATPVLTQRLGRVPTIEETAAELDVDPSKLVDARRAMELRGIGLDTPVADDNPRGQTVAETLWDAKFSNFPAAIDDRRHIELVRKALEQLTDKERDIIRHRYGLDGAQTCTLRELGERYAVSRERIRQLQNQALKRIRAALTVATTPAARAA